MGKLMIGVGPRVEEGFSCCTTDTDGSRCLYQYRASVFNVADLHSFGGVYWSVKMCDFDVSVTLLPVVL